MKIKEEIIAKYKPNGEYPSYYHESDVEGMMEEYAHEHVVEFLQYWDEYRKKMSELAMKARMEGRGLPTWDDRPEAVYKSFIESKK
jgi:hypothetical protein